MKEKLLYDIELLKKQKWWLEISYNECEKIGIKKAYSIDEFGRFETLCSRYARSIDFLVRKFFRSIDEFEFEPQGTLIDVVNKAEKRGLVNVDELHVIKDIRNSIVHEYIDSELEHLFEDVLKYSKKLLLILNNTQIYAQNLVQK